MEMRSDHIDLRWTSRGKHTKRPDSDELAAVEALILLANCDGSFCPKFPTTAGAAAPKEANNFTSLPTTSSITHPNSAIGNASATTTAAANGKNQEPLSPATPLMSNSTILHPMKHQQQPFRGTATASAPTAAAVSFKNQEPYSAPDTQIVAVSSIFFHRKKHQQQQPFRGTETAPATTGAAVSVKNQELYSPDTHLMANSSIFHPKKHQQHQSFWGTATAFASATTSAAVNVEKQERPRYSPDTPLITTSPNFHAMKQQQKPPAWATATASAAVSVKKQEPYSTETPPTAVAYHYCGLCGSRFHSPQALGEHMTSHRPKPQTTTTSAAERDRIHECSCCHERFPTGQALGGHKRKHYEGPLIARKSKNCPSTSSHIERDDGAAATSHVARPFIDLNMPPPPEE